MILGPVTPIVMYVGASSTLTAQQVVELRELQSMGASYQALSDRYGITYGTVGGIVKRKTWSHLP